MAALLFLLCLSLVAATCSLTNMSGRVLGVQGLSRWAVVGDVTNPSKPAHAVANRIQDSGRTVYLVSPYARRPDEGIYKKLSDVPHEIDAVNLIVSPRMGLKVLEEMAERNIRYCFIQPGADTPDVLSRAAELGIVVQQGCVLVQPLPPLDE